MTNPRFMLLLSMLGGMVLLTGCKSIANGCLKPPDKVNSTEGRPLRIPVGLDSMDTREALKIPPLEDPVVAPVTGPCLEYPPQVEKLPEAMTERQFKKEEKQRIKDEKKASKEARKTAGKPATKTADP